jgi:hypothetical protein
MQRPLSIGLASELVPELQILRRISKQFKVRSIAGTATIAPESSMLSWTTAG